MAAGRGRHEATVRGSERGSTPHQNPRAEAIGDIAVAGETEAR